MISKRWTIAELTRYVRQIFDTDYRLQDLEVEGEISDFRIPGSGHAYFTLKDAKAQLRCVMWRNAVEAQDYRPRPGDHVIALGHLSVYEATGQYQLYCRSLQPAGVGDLHAQFEALKTRLDGEGLFDPERKRPTPDLPQTIGVVTSASTAAFQDVLNVLQRRYPLARVVLSPTPVQGDKAPPKIVAALEAINTQDDVDVVLLVRGGGSLEDLWCFNDERVARAVANSRIPVISGVGHEIDFTLADFAADLRAPTPSAAAELATPITVEDLWRVVQAGRGSLIMILRADLDRRQQQVEQVDFRLGRLSPRATVDNYRQQLDSFVMRSLQALRSDLRLRQARLEGARRALQAISPHDTLARGYAIVHDGSGKIVTRADDLAPGDPLDIVLHEGRVKAKVDA